MSHDEVQAELLAYHFGLLEGEARLRVEDHLKSCASCVASFVDAKRAVEVGEQGHEAPSAHVRKRLRRAVAEELGVETVPIRRRFWERPVAFAVAASVLLVASRTTRLLTSGSPTAPHAVLSGQTPPPSPDR